MTLQGHDHNSLGFTKKRLIVQKAFEEYWKTVGFPEVAGLERQLRIKIHQEYFNAMLFRDLVERHDIFYFKSRDGREVDFVAQSRDQSRMLVQVCELMVDPKTRQREITSLSAAMAELKMSSGTIVTRSEDDRLRVESGEIDVVPAWRFLLKIA